MSGNRSSYFFLSPPPAQRAATAPVVTRGHSYDSPAQRGFTHVYRSCFRLPAARRSAAARVCAIQTPAVDTPHHMCAGMFFQLKAAYVLLTFSLFLKLHANLQSSSAYICRLFCFLGRSVYLDRYCCTTTTISPESMVQVNLHLAREAESGLPLSAQSRNVLVSRHAALVQSFLDSPATARSLAMGAATRARLC
jgi:hypothetical protein